MGAALPDALVRRGHDARVFVPLYSSIDLEAHDLVPVEGLQDLSLELGAQKYAYSVYRAFPPESGLPVHFVHCPVLYDRPHLYTSDADEPIRFILLQRAALESCQRLGWSPDIVHCHDWQAGLLPLYLKTLYAWDDLFKSTKSVLTIHNLGYQGVFESDLLGVTGLAAAAKYLHQRDLQEGRIGFLKTGILWADLLTTVSPTYAQEIQTKDFGMGLDDLLRQRPETLVGILNGIDAALWNPRQDPYLDFRYSSKSLWRKEKNKEALLDEIELEYEKGVPAIGMITRLTYQKGIDLLEETLPEVLESRDVRLLVLGSGEPSYERFFEGLQARFRGKVFFYRGFNAALAHRIEAAADIFVMPSIYEPCGLNQMYSARYGAVPVVRGTGGLADTVTSWDPDTEEGNGIVFDHPTPPGVRWAIETALDLYADPKTWKKIVTNGMALDFSWDQRVEEYLRVYERVLTRHVEKV